MIWFSYAYEEALRLPGMLASFGLVPVRHVSHRGVDWHD